MEAPKLAWIWLCVAGCDYGVVRVTSSADSVSFVGPDGEGVPEHKIDMDTWEGSLPDGGSVTASSTTESSPTASSSDSITVEGLVPGDHLLISSQVQRLPVGCYCRIIDDVVDTATAATWTVAASERVVGRIIFRWWNHDFQGSGGYTVIDGKPDTFAPPNAYPWPTNLIVEIVVCDEADYDDVREVIGSIEC